jgi:hypothetical protein
VGVVPIALATRRDVLLRALAALGPPPLSSSRPPFSNGHKELRHRYSFAAEG